MLEITYDDFSIDEIVQKIKGNEIGASFLSSELFAENLMVMMLRNSIFR